MSNSALCFQVRKTIDEVTFLSDRVLPAYGQYLQKLQLTAKQNETLHVFEKKGGRIVNASPLVCVALLDYARHVRDFSRQGKFLERLGFSWRAGGLANANQLSLCCGMSDNYTGIRPNGEYLHLDGGETVPLGIGLHATEERYEPNMHIYRTLVDTLTSSEIQIPPGGLYIPFSWLELDTSSPEARRSASGVGLKFWPSYIDKPLVTRKRELHELQTMFRSFCETSGWDEWKRGVAVGSADCRGSYCIRQEGINPVYFVGTSCQDPRWISGGLTREGKPVFGSYESNCDLSIAVQGCRVVSVITRPFYKVVNRVIKSTRNHSNSQEPDLSPSDFDYG